MVNCWAPAEFTSPRKTFNYVLELFTQKSSVSLYSNLREHLSFWDCPGWRCTTPSTLGPSHGPKDRSCSGQSSADRIVSKLLQSERRVRACLHSNFLLNITISPMPSVRPKLLNYLLIEPATVPSSFSLVHILPREGFSPYLNLRLRL